MRRRNRYAVPAIAAVGLTLFTASLPLRDLWSPDEPRYAEVAREMLVRGDGLVPHLNGETYMEKPPLFFWLAAALQRLGLGYGAGRLVSALMAVATALLTYAIGRLWFSWRAAWTGAFVLLTAELYLETASYGTIDTTLSFFTTLALYAYYRYQRTGGAWIVLFYVAMALATLTKGPVGMLVPALGALASAVSRDGWRGLRARHVLWGAPLVLVVVGLWLVPACLAGGEEYTRTILWKQNIGRTYDSWSKQESWTYHFLTFPAGFAPWTVFLPWALLSMARERPAGGERRERALLLWFLLGFLFFTLVSGKRDTYLLPLYPAVSLIVGRFLVRVERAATAGRVPAPFAWHARLLDAAGLLLGAGIAGSPLVLRMVVGHLPAGQEDVADLLRDLARLPWSAGLVLSGGGVVALSLVGWRAASRGRVRVYTATLFARIILLALPFHVVLTPKINELKSPRDVALRLNEVLPPASGGTVGAFPHVFRGAYNLYSGRSKIHELAEVQAVVEFLAQPGPRVVLTCEKEYRRHLVAATAGYHVEHVRRVGHRRMLFVSNFPTAGAPSRHETHSSDRPDQP